MEESFELCSSMSPKISKTKTKKSSSTVLATRKHFRRISELHKLPKTNNHVILVAGSTDSSTVGSSNITEKSLDKSIQSSILIETDHTASKVPKTKVSMICEWLKGLECDFKKEITPNMEFDDVSRIGDNSPINEGIALSSTLISAKLKPFHKCFNEDNEYNSNKYVEDSIDTSLRDELENKRKESNGASSSQQKDKSNGSVIIIEDSFIVDTADTGNTVFSSDEIPSSYDGIVQQNGDTDDKENISRNSQEYNNNIYNDHAHQTEMENMLDAIYGNSWRCKKDSLIPKTEPKKSYHPPIQFSKTERKPSLKKVDIRKPSDKSTSLKPLQENNVEKLIVSPWIERFKDICDSDTSQEDDFRPAIKFKTKLKFDDSDDDIYENNEKDNDFELPLEDRLKKQMDSLAISNKTKSNITKSNILKKVVPDSNSEKKNKNVYSTKKVKKKEISDGDNPLTNIPTRCLDNDEEWDKQINKIFAIRRKSSCLVKSSYSFLESLSGSIPLKLCNPTASIYRTSYKQQKEKLAQALFQIYNDNVFENKLPSDMVLEWNDRLRGTAGLCECKKITRKSGKVERSAKIALSTKVLDSADRLRDTLIHELCHAATWIVNCVSDGHGPFWKSWAYKAMAKYPELPPIKRCHDYIVNTKYVYKCVGCGYRIGRHSKSLDIERKCCGYCHGKFEILINKVSKNGTTKTVPVTPKKDPTPFAMFVKENYAIYKSPSRKHGDVMKLLGQKFAEVKVKAS